MGSVRVVVVGPGGRVIGLGKEGCWEREMGREMRKRERGIKDKGNEDRVFWLNIISVPRITEKYRLRRGLGILLLGYVDHAVTIILLRITYTQQMR